MAEVKTIESRQQRVAKIRALAEELQWQLLSDPWDQRRVDELRAAVRQAYRGLGCLTCENTERREQGHGGTS